MKKLTRQKGFTLLEILIASAIFFMVSAASFSMLTSAQRSQEQMEEFSTRLFETQKAMLFMFRDFGQVAKRSHRNEFGDPAHAFMGKSDEQGEQSFVEFVRHGWRNPLSIPRSSMQHVRYRWEEGQIIREHWNYVDLVSGVQPYQTALLENVEALDFKFLYQTQWVNEWPNNPNAEVDMTVPRAIEVSITTPEFGKIVRTFRMVDE
ncbi:MAG: type II secretion system minor pseudopilin GspJ [Pseudomonadota bacterium]